MLRQFEHFASLTTLFFTRAAERGDRPFLCAKVNGVWVSRNWASVARDVSALSAALVAEGVRPGDRVMLVSENRPEFCIADLAIMAMGGVTVPTYTTNMTRDHAHIISDSGASAVIFSSAKIGKQLLPAVMRSSIHLAISMEPQRVSQEGNVRLLDWDALIAAHPADVAATAAAQSATRADLACIIYTSGTGGSPRGVMQHHGAILCNVEGCHDILAGDFGWDETEVFLSFLPLSHAYEHSAGQYLPIAMGGEIHYAESLEKLATNITEARPTVMVVVPRLFELLRVRISKAVAKEGRLGQWLLDAALAQGARAARRGGMPWWEAPLGALLDRTIRPKIRARFGGRLKALVSGGAPLNPEVGRFFEALGLTLLQGYGQTEAGPVISCNRPRAGVRMDSVGPPLKNVELRIAADGEILVRGELVMHGYWRNEAETARVLQDGWLHTGDIGEIDEGGRLRITDRKKDLIVNDKGDNVAPQRVEGMLTLQSEIGQAMVFGDRRPHLVALIVPDPDFVRPVDDAAFLAALRAAVDRVNADLSVTEKVRRFVLADEPFTVENGEMTPSLKIRRHVIRGRYQDRLEGLYGG